jgi:hypothetical protein
MIKLTAPREKRLPDTTSVNWLDRTSSIRLGGRRNSSTAPVNRHFPQSIPVPGISRSIEVKIASTESEWEQAFELAASNYQARGYETSGANRLRFTPYHALPDTLTLVAKYEDEVVATFSIVPDNELLGLPMEDVYSDEIANLRREGRRLFEATILADRGLSHREFLQVFFTLIKLSMQYHTYHDGDSYVIAVNPRHRKFYTKIIGFVPLGSLRAYAAVQDAPAEAFLLDNRLQQENVPDTYQLMFGEPLPREALVPVPMPQPLIRSFSRRSIHCDPGMIDDVIAYTDEHGSTRRW